MIVQDTSRAPIAQTSSLQPADTRMFTEAAEAANVVARQLRTNADQMARIGARLRADPPRAVVTCARGSSDHAATFAKYLFETRVGVITSSASPSISSVYDAPPQLQGVLYLAISQSGKSPDLLNAVQKARDGGAFTVAIVNDVESPLATLVDEVLPMCAGPERSVAATKSFIATLCAIAHLTAEWAEDAELSSGLDRLSEDLAKSWNLDWSQAQSRLVEARNLYVLSRGVGFGVAQEAALKFKETCGLHAEAFSTAEVLHGPMALVKDGFPILAFAQDDETRGNVDQVARDLCARGADVFIAGAERKTGADLAFADETPVRSLDTLRAHPVLEPVLIIQSFYRLANAVSIARGYDPDRPPHLNKVTETF